MHSLLLCIFPFHQLSTPFLFISNKNVHYFHTELLFAPVGLFYFSICPILFRPISIIASQSHNPIRVLGKIIGPSSHFPLSLSHSLSPTHAVHKDFHNKHQPGTVFPHTFAFFMWYTACTPSPKNCLKYIDKPDVPQLAICMAYHSNLYYTMR